MPLSIRRLLLAALSVACQWTVRARPRTVVSRELDDLPQHSEARKGVLAGSIIGGFGLMTFIAVIILFRCRRTDLPTRAARDPPGVQEQHDAIPPRKRAQERFVIEDREAGQAQSSTLVWSAMLAQNRAEDGASARPARTSVITEATAGSGTVVENAITPLPVAHHSAPPRSAYPQPLLSATLSVDARVAGPRTLKTHTRSERFLPSEKASGDIPAPRTLPLPDARLSDHQSQQIHANSSTSGRGSVDLREPYARLEREVTSLRAQQELHQLMSMPVEAPPRYEKT
ncbi:hypothetical protein C8Q76DRAFT_727897 [Earliella scabrosa]|nr:hypothetical protein C8Q76DRAFT_727897 [Earliella scabrosa]